MNEKKKSALIAAEAYSALAVMMGFGTYIGSMIFSDELGLLFGLLLMIPAVVFYILGKKRKLFAFLPMILNGLGCGFMVSAYFNHVDCVPAISDLLIAFGGIILLFALSIGLFALTDNRGIVSAVFGLLSLALLIVFAVLWGINGGVAYPVFFFASLLLPWFIVVFDVCTVGDDPALSQAGFWTFGVALVVFLVVIVCIGGDCDCDGSCCDCGGADCGSGGKKKKK